MVKVYQYQNTCSVGIYWTYRTDDPFENRILLGRRILNLMILNYGL